MLYIREYVLENKTPTLDDLYECASQAVSDINEHCPTLVELAKECPHITEFGTRWGVSTVAFMYARPQKLVCYDMSRQYVVDIFERVAKKENIPFEYIQKNDLEVTIEETDLLFIDTLHTYTQLRQELAMHADKARKYIVMHDTETFAITGGPHKVNDVYDKGLKFAIEEFLAKSPEWRIKAHYPNNSGLTVLGRLLP